MKLMYRKEKIEEATNILMLPLTSGNELCQLIYLGKTFFKDLNNVKVYSKVFNFEFALTAPDRSNSNVYWRSENSNDYYLVTIYYYYIDKKYYMAIQLRGTLKPNPPVLVPTTKGMTKDKYLKFVKEVFNDADLLKNVGFKISALNNEIMEIKKELSKFSFKYYNPRVYDENGKIKIAIGNTPREFRHEDEYEVDDRTSRLRVAYEKESSIIMGIAEDFEKKYKVAIDVFA